MSIRPRAARESDLSALLERCRTDSLTYVPAGVSMGDLAPAGFKRRHWTTPLAGSNAFERAVEALRTWEMHRGAGLRVAADGPIAVGTNVAFSAPLPIGFVDGTCRIVVVVEEPNRFGFAYGTLSIHPESGEEAFVVSRDQDGNVRIDIDGVSRVTQPFARLVPRAADQLQDRAVRRYLAAMRTLTRD
ncbi:MAG TPA: DUF1990 domain-containing protein [Candidatus Elarobacter sp.]|nr:DUF1990 domain-containing protein [Candidatus Elarobacter sp.]